MTFHNHEIVFFHHILISELILTKQIHETIIYTTNNIRHERSYNSSNLK